MTIPVTTDRLPWTVAQKLWITSFVVVIGLYIAAQMMSDIMSLRILAIGGLAVDGGTLVYPLTFTLRDMIHKVAGVRAARTAIFLAAGVNLGMAGLFQLVAWLPADTMTGPQDEFGMVLGAVWRIVIASIIAEVIAELIDTEVYRAWTRQFKERMQWGRVLSSNAVAIPVDSFLFTAIAFAGILPFVVMREIFFTNLLVKGVVTILSIPLIYAVKPPPQFTTAGHIDAPE